MRFSLHYIQRVLFTGSYTILQSRNSIEDEELKRQEGKLVTMERESTINETDLKQFLTCHINDQTVQKDIIGWYDEWSDKYQQCVDNLEQQGPAAAADYIQKHYGDQLSTRILDVACGAGAVALKLTERRFTNIDGLDPSSGMIDRARELRVYNKLICSFVEQVSEQELPKGTYDIVVCVGAIAPNHISSTAVVPMCSFLKPGGILMIIGCQECWKKFPVYHINTRAEFDRLLDEGQIEMMVDREMDKYLKTDKWVKGVFFVFRKLAV